MNHELGTTVSVWHPAAGTATGDVLLWTLPSQECLLEMSCASPLLTESVAVNRIVWGPEGNCFGERSAAVSWVAAGGLGIFD